MATDYTKKPNEIVIDLINESNTTTFGITDLTLGAPSAGTTKNSQVDVTATETSGYIGTVTVEYDRIDAAVVPGQESINFKKGAAVNVSDLIAEINTRYGINLTADDYTEAALPAEPAAGAKVDLAIVINPASLVYTGTLALKLAGPDAELSTVLTNLVLDGLVYVPPTIDGLAADGLNVDGDDQGGVAPGGE